MRISLIGPFPPYRGGISDFNSALFKELDKSHDVQLINYSTQYPNILFPGKSQYKVDVSNLNLSDRCLSSINPFTWRKSARKVSEFQPHLVVIHYWMPFFAPALRMISKLIKKRTDVQIIAICHNLTPHEKQSFGRTFTKSFLKKVDKFIVMAETVKDDLLNLIPNAKYKLSPHPIYDIFGEIVNKNEARINLSIKHKNVVLYFGLIREYKGLDILLKSIPIIKDELSDFILIVAGECYENQQKYYDIIKKLKIQDSVDMRLKFIPDDEVNVYFSAADVVALPYRTATQSGIIQIAYNYNRPVIVSEVGGLSEIVIDTETGYVVEPQSAEFAKAITKFFKDSKYDEFTNNIKIHKQRYSWSNFVEKMMELTS